MEPQDRFDLPEMFDIEQFDLIEDAEIAEKDRVVEGGLVESWNCLEVLEKGKVRLYLTSVCVSMWIICIVTALVRFAVTGDYVPVVALLSIILPIVFYYYYYERMQRRNKTRNK